MVNKCLVVGCKTGHRNGPVKASFHLPYAKPELLSFWLKFINRQEYSCDPAKKCEVVCIDHFDEKFIIRGTSRTYLNWKLHPVPTKNSGEMLQGSTFEYKYKEPRKAPKDRILQKDELKDFQNKDLIRYLSDLNESHAPQGFSFKKGEGHVIYYNLKFDDESGFPNIFESIKIDEELHVKLQQNGCPVPLPDFFVKGTSAKLTSCGAILNLASYLKNKDENDVYPFLDELRMRKNFKPQGRPPFSSSVIRYALLLRHTSLQSYRLLLQRFPMPSLSLLDKIHAGGIDVLKAVKLLRERGEISEDVMVLVDEMYLQKSCQYHSGDFVGDDEEGNLYKGIVVFMVVGLKKSVSYVVKAIPEIKVTGDLVANGIKQVIESLTGAGFNVRGVVSDNHSANVSAFRKLLVEFGNHQSDLFIQHPSNKDKTYLFYDNVHILKNIRNNLLLAKTFSFPAFSFSVMNKVVECSDGSISWGDLHRIHDEDCKLSAHLKKAPKLGYSALHPSNNKQNVNLALAIFHNTTIAAAKSYFPEKHGLANFLELIALWWTIVNSNTRFDSRGRLGNAIVAGDGKILFFRLLADYLEGWCRPENPFSLTSQTSSALIRTLRAQASLTDDLLKEGYDFVIPRKFQSDALERRFSQYRQMSGGRFLVSLREVQHSERILACRALLKIEVDFWNEDLTKEVDTKEIEEFEREIEFILGSHLYEASLDQESNQVAVYIAGYICKKMLDAIECQSCKDLLEGTEQDHYFQLLNNGGLKIPSPHLIEFVSSAFAILDMTDVHIAMYKSISVSVLARLVLKKYTNCARFTCNEHLDWARKISIKTVINIFYNNKQKEKNSMVRKCAVTILKTKQRSLKD